MTTSQASNTGVKNISIGMQRIQSFEKPDNRTLDEAFLKSVLPEDQAQIA